jgi:hypothetical protein
LLTKRLQDQIQAKATEVLQIYDDVDGDLKHEQNVFSGQLSAQTGMPVTEDTLWQNFYQKVHEID